LVGSSGDAAGTPSQRFVIVTELKDASRVVLQQTSTVEK
jgi:hypothetical protein